MKNLKPFFNNLFFTLKNMNATITDSYISNDIRIIYIEIGNINIYIDVKYKHEDWISEIVIVLYYKDDIQEINFYDNDSEYYKIKNLNLMYLFTKKYKSVDVFNILLRRYIRKYKLNIFI